MELAEKRPSTRICRVLPPLRNCQWVAAVIGRQSCAERSSSFRGLPRRFRYSGLANSIRGLSARRRAVRLLSARFAIRTAKSSPSLTMSTRSSVISSSILSAGFSRRNSTMSGVAIFRPNATEVVKRNTPDAVSPAGLMLA